MVPWIAGIILAVIAGMVVVFAVRRWAQREDGTQTFTFQDLRDMRARGEITDHEFVAMRDALLSRMSLDEPPDAPASPESGAAGRKRRPG